MYQFLAAPYPWQDISVEQNKSEYDGLNAAVLVQRHDFLRPDSLVAVVVITDEDDSSLDPLSVAPASVTRAVQASLPAPSPPPRRRRVRGELGASVVSALVPGLRTAFGLDAKASLWLTPRFGGYARAGFTRGSREKSFHSSAASDVLRGGVGGFAGLVPGHERVGLRVEAGVDVLRVSFRGEALERGMVHAAPALAALDASLGLRSWIDLGPVRALVALAGHYAVAPAVGTDQTVQGEKSKVAGVKGVGLEASMGAAWVF